MTTPAPATDEVTKLRTELQAANARADAAEKELGRERGGYGSTQALLVERVRQVDQLQEWLEARDRLLEASKTEIDRVTAIANKNAAAANRNADLVCTRDQQLANANAEIQRLTKRAGDGVAKGVFWGGIGALALSAAAAPRGRRG